MAYRYCPECDRWLETSEYTVDEIGETICPDHEIALHGYIGGSLHGPYTERDLLRDNDPKMYDDWDSMRAAARRQQLVVA